MLLDQNEYNSTELANPGMGSPLRSQMMLEAMKPIVSLLTKITEGNKLPSERKSVKLNSSV